MSLTTLQLILAHRQERIAELLAAPDDDPMFKELRDEKSSPDINPRSRADRIAWNENEIAKAIAKALRGEKISI